MKILIQILLIISLPLMGCRESGEVVWTGTQSFMFNGAELKLPNDGKGNFSTSPLELRYDWNGNVLTIKDLGDNTVSVTTPLVKNVIVKKSDLIIISPEGELIIWPPNKKPNKSEQVTPRKTSD